MLLVDPERAKDPEQWHTGIMVEAWCGDTLGCYDIAMLTRDSLKEWLTRGTHETMAESVVMALLGYR